MKGQTLAYAGGTISIPKDADLPIEGRRFLASMNDREREKFSNYLYHFHMMSSKHRIALSGDAMMRCAAFWIDRGRKGEVVSLFDKLGKVPEDWPAVVEKVKREKKVSNEPSEADIQDEVIKHLKSRGWLVIRMNSGSFKVNDRYFRAYILENNGRSDGFPDLLAFKRDRYLLIEMKRPGTYQSPEQKIFEQMCAERGVGYHVVRSVEDAARISR
jgi:hypothetical protein